MLPCIVFALALGFDDDMDEDVGPWSVLSFFWRLHSASKSLPSLLVGLLMRLPCIVAVVEPTCQSLVGLSTLPGLDGRVDLGCVGVSGVRRKCCFCSVSTERSLRMPESTSALPVGKCVKVDLPSLSSSMLGRRTLAAAMADFDGSLGEVAVGVMDGDVAVRFGRGSHGCC